MQRRRHSADQWLEWLLEQPGTGQTISRFCSAKGVSQKTFYVWRHKLRKELKSARRKEAKDSRAAAFVPVEVLGSDPVAVEFPCGAKARVPVDESSLRLVFRVLLELGSQS